MGRQAMKENDFCPEMAGKTDAETSGFRRGKIERYKNFSDHDSIHGSVRERIDFLFDLDKFGVVWRKIFLGGLHVKEGTVHLPLFLEI